MEREYMARNRVNREDYERERYAEYRRRSTSGSSAKRDPNRRIKMRYSDYKRTLKATAIASAIAISLVLAGGSHYVDTIKDKMYLGQLAGEFKTEYIAPETHRTNDNEHYFYDYMDIAHHMKEAEDFDEKVYLLTATLGDYQADQVMVYTDYKGLDNYLAQHNFNDSEEFIKVMEEKTLAEKEMNEQAKAMNEMLEDHNVELNDRLITGGAK